jgi:hypothetical protein
MMLVCFASGSAPKPESFILAIRRITFFQIMDDKRLLAFDALVLSERLGRAVGRGKIHPRGWPS